MSGHHHGHHDHSSHHHHHAPGTRKEKILFAAFLNLGFTIIELIGGLLTNSVAVLADAVHDLGDCFALFGAYIAEGQAERPADTKRTFGYARISVLSALFSAVILIVGSLFIFIEAVGRLLNPEPVLAGWVALLAVFGIATNYLAYAKLQHGHSANEKVLSWHLLEDVLGWVAVLIGAGLMYLTGWYIIDSLLTIGFTLFILWGVVRSLKEVVNLIMEGVPSRLDLAKVKDSLTSVAGVVSVHDIHAWSLDGEKIILTGHVVAAEGQLHNRIAIYQALKEVLKEYHIEHTTIEFEEEGEACEDRCD